MTTIESLEKLRADTSEQEAHFRKHGDVSEADMYEEIVARLDDVRKDVAAAVAAERERVLAEVHEALKPGYGAVPASDAEILEFAREVVAKQREKESGT